MEHKAPSIITCILQVERDLERGYMELSPSIRGNTMAMGHGNGPT